MKRAINLVVIGLLSFSYFIFTQPAAEATVTLAMAKGLNTAAESQGKEPAKAAPAAVTTPTPVAAKPKIILLIAEQNIEGPQKAWWASEIDLSTVESAVAQKLIEAGYEVIEPSALNKVIKKQPAFRKLGLTENDSIEMAKLAGVDFVVLGKAVASSGGNIPQSNMRSYFANVTAKLIKVKEAKVAVYLDSTGNSAHLDTITGGREALIKAGNDLAAKILSALQNNK